MSRSDVAFENMVVLQLVQAMVGSVSRNFRWVACSVAENQSIQFTFVLETDSALDRAEIADIVAEFDALQPHGIDYSVAVVVDARSNAGAPPGRLVYGRRE